MTPAELDALPVEPLAIEPAPGGIRVLPRGWPAGAEMVIPARGAARRGPGHRRTARPRDAGGERRRAAVPA